MNENIDLTKILKDCPKGTKLYSTVYGVVRFDEIDKDNTFPISLYVNPTFFVSVTSDGRHVEGYDGECTLFPSKDQRDWSKFKAPWYKRSKFDPRTLKPFQKVLIWKELDCTWMPTLFTYLDFSLEYPRMRYDSLAVKVIPYNDDTKHLLGKSVEAPEYYRYWENLIKNRRYVMTREEIEQLNEVEPYCFETNREEQWYRVGLQEGLSIADANPKSPWISVEDDLPCNHKKLLNPDDKKIYTSYVVAIIHGYIIMSRMYKLNGKWYWENDEPTYWMPIPKSPKE